MKKLTAKKKIRQIRMFKKNLKKVEKRKNKKEKERGGLYIDGNLEEKKLKSLFRIRKRR